MAVMMPRALGGRRYWLDHGAMTLAWPENWSAGAYSQRDRSLGKTRFIVPRAGWAPEPSSQRSGAQLVTMCASNGISEWYTASLEIPPSSSILPTYTSTSPPPGAREVISESPVDTGWA